MLLGTFQVEWVKIVKFFLSEQKHFFLLMCLFEGVDDFGTTRIGLKIFLFLSLSLYPLFSLSLSYLFLHVCDLSAACSTPVDGSLEWRHHQSLCTNGYLLGKNVTLLFAKNLTPLSFIHFYYTIKISLFIYLFIFYLFYLFIFVIFKIS